MSSSYPLKKASSFNGEWYCLWKDKMNFFIKWMDPGICKTMREGLFVPTHKVNGVVVKKHGNNWTKDDKENAQRWLKAKTITTIALGLDEILQVSHYDTSKEMWGILQITHEITTKVKRERLSPLTHEYELFEMKPEESCNTQCFLKYSNSY